MFASYDHDNKIWVVDTHREMSMIKAKPIVLPKHHEQVLFHPIILDENWWLLFLIHLD